MKRRKFITGATLSAAGLLLSGNINGANRVNNRAALSRDEVTAATDNIYREVKKYRKIDAYANAYPNSNLAKIQIEMADKLGIEKLFIALPMVDKKWTPPEFREANDLVIKAVQQYPDRLVGQLTLNPTYPKEALEEIKRCVDMGMVGMKIYNSVKINDPLFYPIIEQFIDLKMLVHVHAESTLGVGGYRMKYDVRKAPNMSVPEDFVAIAKRYPEAMFQYAHIGGGGDWEYACKALKNSPNVFVDTGGSNNEAFLVDFAVQELGTDRVFFGCDSSYLQGVGKILAANLTEAQKRKIFFENYNKVLKKAGHQI